MHGRPAAFSTPLSVVLRTKSPKALNWLFRAMPWPAGACICKQRPSTTSYPRVSRPARSTTQIIGVVKHLQESRKQRDVILVSKDINMRIKARAVGLAAEDYFNDRVLEDTDLLYTGLRELPDDFWEFARERHGILAAGRS